MKLPKLPCIIQGGMGAAVSVWGLAHAVAMAGDDCMGTVSGTAIDVVLARRLQHGDPTGCYQRAFAAFPNQEIAQHVWDRYFIAAGKESNAPYKPQPMFSDAPRESWIEDVVVANFVEVWLAKEGHDGLVAINYLEKIQVPHIFAIYGAMLAGVDYILMGAGIPWQIPHVIQSLLTHQSVSYELDVDDAPKDSVQLVSFDPATLGMTDVALRRPSFLPIISSTVLAASLLRRSPEGGIQGFICEKSIAGGHNAPPRRIGGEMPVDENGRPVYGDKDEMDFSKMPRDVPFWIAGGYGTTGGLQKALDEGATGIQVGTLFAYCDESGMAPEIKKRYRAAIYCEEAQVVTEMRSPSGYPFKIVQLETDESLANPAIYEARDQDRICNVGHLRTAYYDKAGGTVRWRCPAEPVKTYVRKGGAESKARNQVCLCNALMATCGLPQLKSQGYNEPPIVTSGVHVEMLKLLMQHENDHYSAAAVIALVRSKAE